MKMEDIDGGLHPAVDEQSLDEDEENNKTKRGNTKKRNLEKMKKK